MLKGLPTFWKPFLYFVISLKTYFPPLVYQNRLYQIIDILLSKYKAAARAVIILICRFKTSTMFPI